MKKDILKFISVLLCYVMLFNCFTFPVMAEELPSDPVLSGAEEADPEMTVPAETVASEDEELLPEVDETGEAEEYDDPDPGQKQFTVRVRKQNEDDYGQSIDDSDFDTPEEVDAYISGLADDSYVDVVINFIGEGETLVLDPDNMSDTFGACRKKEIRFSGEVDGWIDFHGIRPQYLKLGLDIRSDGFVRFTDCRLPNTLYLFNTRVRFCSENEDVTADPRSIVDEICVFDRPNAEPSEVNISNTSLECLFLESHGCELPVFSVSPGVRFGDFHLQTITVYCDHAEFAKVNTPDRVSHSLLLRDYCGDTYPDGNGPVILNNFMWLCDIEEECYDSTYFLLDYLYENPEHPERVLDVERYSERYSRYTFCTISDPHEIVEIDYQDELGKVAGAMLAGDTIDLRDYERVFERMKDGSERVMRRVYSLSYDSADPGVATVNEEGILTAHGVGQTVVTVTSNENPQVTRRIDVKVMEPVTNVTIGCDKTDIKRISKTSLTAEVTPYSENINPEIRWSVLAKEGDGEEYAADDFATITTVSTNGAVTVGELKVNTKKTAQELENLQLKVRATAAGGQGDTVFAEKTFTVSDTAPITGIVLTPESQIVSAVSATVIKATLLPEDQITDPGLEWTVCPMEGKTELEDLDAEDFYIRPDPEKPEATLYVHTTTVSTRGAIDIVRVKATSKSARDGNGRPLVGSTDIAVSPVIVPDQIRFDKKTANVCYGEDVTYNITASVAGADPEVSIALFECTYNNGNRVLSRITTPGPYHITSTKDKDHTKISFSADPVDGNNRKHTLVIRATSTYAFKGGRNDSSYIGDYLIYDETEIRLNNRYYLEEDVLNLDVGDIHTLKLYDHKTGKPVKAAGWRSAGESLVTAASDGTIKALHAGTTQVIPLKKEGTELIPYQTESGRMVSATVYVRDMVEAPTATVSPARSDGLRIGDVITLETPTNGATIKYTTAPASLPDENYSPTNPIEVTLAKTLPINGRSDARQLTVKTKAETIWVSSATRTYTYLVYLDLGPGQTGDVTPADVAYAGGVERIPDGLWMSKIAPQCYTGEKIVPDVRVYHGKKMLVEGSDYTVAVSDNVKAHDETVNGTSPTLTVTFKNGYSGKLKQTFAIDQIDLADEAVLVPNYEVTYTGSVQKIVPVVTYNGKTLKNKTDFTVEYPDTEAGAYQEPNAGRISETYHGYAIRLKAKENGNFKGIRTVYLKIRDEKLLANCKVDKIKAQDYTGNPITPEPVVKYKSAKLKNGDDYELTYENNTLPGTATVIITAKGGYYGEIRQTFTINPVNIAKASVTGLFTDYEYKGMPVDPFSVSGSDAKVILKINGEDEELEKGTHFDVTYAKNDTAGTATALLTGKGIYGGTKTFKFKISAFDLSKNPGNKASVDINPQTVTFNSSGAVLSYVTVRLYGHLLTENKDYTVTYKNNKAAGTKGTKNAPTVDIKGKGPLKGTISKEFSIDRAPIDDTTMYVNDVVYKEKANNAVTTVKLTDQNGKTLSAGKDYDKQLFRYYDEETWIISAATLKKPEPLKILREAGTPVSADDVVPAGTVLRMQVLGKGNYKGAKTCKYRIGKMSLSQASCSIKADTAAALYYRGQPVYLNADDIIVKVGGKKVPAKNADDSVNYVIVGYEKNTAAGNASVIIRGAGDYVGDKKISFKIKQMAAK